MLNVLVNVPAVVPFRFSGRTGRYSKDPGGIPTKMMDRGCMSAFDIGLTFRWHSVYGRQLNPDFKPTGDGLCSILFYAHRHIQCRGGFDIQLV